MTKREYSNEIKEYRTRLAKALWENKKLKEKIQDHQILKKIIAHDARSPITNIIQLTQLLKEEGENFTPELINEFYGYLDSNAKKVLNLYDTISFEELTKEELIKKSKPFQLEEIALNNAHSLSNKFKEAKIRLDFKYNENSEPINSNQNLFESLYSNIMGNCINNALENTIVKSGIRRNNSQDLEIVAENKENGQKQRKIEGLGKGYGSEIINKTLKLLNGKLEVYNHSIIGKDYDILYKLGAKEIQENKNKDYKTYAIKITIPKSEISANKEK